MADAVRNVNTGGAARPSDKSAAGGGFRPRDALRWASGGFLWGLLTFIVAQWVFSAVVHLDEYYDFFGPALGDALLWLLPFRWAACLIDAAQQQSLWVREMMTYSLSPSQQIAVHAVLSGLLGALAAVILAGLARSIGRVLMARRRA